MVYSICGGLPLSWEVRRSDGGNYLENEAVRYNMRVEQAALSDERRKTLDQISYFGEKKKDFVPLLTRFHSFPAKYENYLPI